MAYLFLGKALTGVGLRMRHHRCVGRPFRSPIASTWKYRKNSPSQVPLDSSTSLKDAGVIDFDESHNDDDDSDTRTDREKGKTHGYEGDFKVGDIVRVVVDTTMFSVPGHKEGVSLIGASGTVTELALYGRKKGSLCSAITPIKVRFEAEQETMDEGLFTRAFTLHYSAEELELIERPRAQ